MRTLGQVYLESVIGRITTYKTLGDRTFAQLEEPHFHLVPAPGSNSIALIIQHVSGNMLSRWTNFLTEDGEKEWRNRETEFSPHSYDRAQLIGLWEKGWACLLDALGALTEADLLKTIYIRHEPLSVVDAINRQLAHYPYHVGQILYIGKMVRGTDWTSLSIAPGQSGAFNREMEQTHRLSK